MRDGQLKKALKLKRYSNQDLDLLAREADRRGLDISGLRRKKPSPSHRTATRGWPDLVEKKPIPKITEDPALVASRKRNRIGWVVFYLLFMLLFSLVLGPLVKALLNGAGIATLTDYYQEELIGLGVMGPVFLVLLYVSRRQGVRIPLAFTIVSFVFFVMFGMIAEQLARSLGI